MKTLKEFLMEQSLPKETEVGRTIEKQKRERDQLKDRQDLEKDRARQKDLANKEKNYQMSKQKRDARQRNEYLELGTDETTEVYKDVVPGQTEELGEDIKKLSDGRYQLVSKKSGKNLGIFDTLDAAQAREREVNFFKNKK